jgi:SAM-dependent methyltransferase
MLANVSVNSNLDKWTSGEAYDAWMGRWSRLLAHDFLRWLSIPNDARWLDMCCGSGILSEAIFQNCSPASIVGIDASPGQIAFAQERRSHSKVTFEVGDAMALPFEEHRFDVAVCGLGLNFVPQPERAVREMRRVSRSGGTIAAYVWDYAQGARFLREFWDGAAAIDPKSADFDQARRFPLCTPDHLQELFEAAGLESVTLGTIEQVTRFESFQDYWEPLNSGQGSAPNYLATRDEQTRNAIRAHLRASLPFEKDGSINLPARAWAIRGAVSY